MNMKIRGDSLAKVFLYGIVFMKTLGLDTTDNIFIRATIILALVMMLYFIMSVWNKREFISFVIASLLGIIIYLFSHRATALTIVLSIFAVLMIDDKEDTIRKIASIWLIVVPIRIVLALVGIIDPQVQNQYSLTGITGVAYGLGYGNKNQLSIAIVVCVLSYIYLRFKNIKLIELLLVCGSGIFLCSRYALSDTGVILIILSAALYLLYSCDNLRKISSLITRFIIPTAIVFSFIIPILYGRLGMFQVLNQLFSTRISLGYKYLQAYPISLFGSDLSGISYNLDNGYLNSYCNFGIIFSLVIFYLYYRTANHYADRRGYDKCFLITIFSILGISEGAFINPAMNYSIVFIGIYLYEINKKADLVPK